MLKCAKIIISTSILDKKYYNGSLIGLHFEELTVYSDLLSIKSVIFFYFVTNASLNIMYFQTHPSSNLQHYQKQTLYVHQGSILQRS